MGALVRQVHTPHHPPPSSSYGHDWHMGPNRYAIYFYTHATFNGDRLSFCHIPWRLAFPCAIFCSDCQSVKRPFPMMYWIYGAGSVYRPTATWLVMWSIPHMPHLLLKNFPGIKFLGWFDLNFSNGEKNPQPKNKCASHCATTAPMLTSTNKLFLQVNGILFSNNKDKHYN